MPSFTCRICGSDDLARLHVVREMMFGTREPHEYRECGTCGCLQIGTIPDDLSAYYPDGYYSQHPLVRRPLKRWMLRQRSLAALGRANPIGLAMLQRDRWAPTPQVAIRALAPLGLRRADRILDVGCGRGELLRALRDLGFVSTKGIDPFNAEDIRYPDGLTIERKSIVHEHGTWDVVMFHHSFEHIPDQHEAMAHAVKALAPGGRLLIRVPVLGAAWAEYGADWVQIDAPRHLYLHTVESLSRLAEGVGLRVDRVQFESTQFQFWGSELCRQDVPWTDGGPRFSRRQMASFGRRARRLNRMGRGDQAAFYLSR